MICHNLHCYSNISAVVSAPDACYLPLPTSYIPVDIPCLRYHIKRVLSLCCPYFNDFFFFFLMMRHPPSSPLFPYPPLFRSPSRSCPGTTSRSAPRGHPGQRPASPRARPPRCTAAAAAARPRPADAAPAACPGPQSWTSCGSRSEEHTSELQSRLHLVCRLLL